MNARMQGRIVRLSSGVAVIRVGGSTAVEMTERKHRIEDALEAVRSAQEGGIVGGGGTTFIVLVDVLEKMIMNISLSPIAFFRLVKHLFAKWPLMPERVEILF